MDFSHSSQRSLPVTPPRQTGQQSTLFTPTPPSTDRHHRMLQTPPNHMSLPLTLPMSTMSAMTMSSMPLSMPMAMPLSMSTAMPLALPTDATTASATQSYNVFGEHMYYGQGGGSASNGNSTGNNNGHSNQAEVANMDFDLGLDPGMDMNLGVGMEDMGMDMEVGMDDFDMGALMHMSMPEDNHMGYAGFPDEQASSSCNAQMSSSSHGSTATNANQNNVRQTTPPSMCLINAPGMLMDSLTASPYGDPPTRYSVSSTTGGGFPFHAPASMAPTTLSSSYPSVYPSIPQAATAAMEPNAGNVSATFTTSMSLPTTSTMSTITMSSPPLTRSRAARHGRTSSIRSASDPIPSTEAHGHGRGRHTRGISFDSAAAADDDDDDYFDDCDMDDGNTPASHQHQNQNQNQLMLRPGPNINGPPPTDPTDWRARLRYCEQAKHKASLDASLVRLLDVSEAVDKEDKIARQSANIRFDKVREQRLKDRNNEAAKRSRQRKVARIEAAEQTIAKLQRGNQQLQRENQQLQQKIAAMASSSSSLSSSPGGKVHKGRAARTPTTPQRRGSGHSGRLNSSSPHNGRGNKHSRRGSDESAIAVEDEEDEDEDETGEVDGYNSSPRHGNSIVVGMLA